MSKYRDEFVLPFSLSVASTICQQALSESKLEVTNKSETLVVCEEHFSFGFTNPARLEVILKVESAGSTRVIINGSNEGFGPVQSGHVKGKVEEIKNNILTEANEKGKAIEVQKTGQIQSSLASEIEKLSKLREQGVISEEEFKQAKAKLLGSQQTN
jgi:hypothetical protein